MIIIIKSIVININYNPIKKKKKNKINKPIILYINIY
jgi:hypothetical protein